MLSNLKALRRNSINMKSGNIEGCKPTPFSLAIVAPHQNFTPKKKVAATGTFCEPKQKKMPGSSKSSEKVRAPAVPHKKGKLVVDSEDDE